MRNFSQPVSINVRLFLVDLTDSADKQTFASLDFIGWFTTAPLSPSTLHVHNIFTSLNPLPILLILDPSGLNASGSETLPITVYESIPGAQTVEVGQVEYRLETGEAERIGVEHVSRAPKRSDDERTDADECDFPFYFLSLTFSGERVTDTS